MYSLGVYDRSHHSPRAKLKIQPNHLKNLNEPDATQRSDDQFAFGIGDEYCYRDNNHKKIDNADRILEKANLAFPTSVPTNTF